MKKIIIGIVASVALVFVWLNADNKNGKTTDDFVVSKKTVVSISGLKQDCVQESIAWLGQGQSRLLTQMGQAGEMFAAIAADLIDGSGNTCFAKPSKTQLEEYQAQIKKICMQAQELSASLQKIQEFVAMTGKK